MHTCVSHAHRPFNAAGARRRLHAGVRAYRHHGDAAARSRRNQRSDALRLGIALLLTLILLPLHRADYHVDLHSLAPLLLLLVHEIVIGLVLGATARVTISALQVAGSVVAQQFGLGFVTAVDPTQGQQAR